MSSPFQKAAANLVTQCFGLQAGEHLLFASDGQKPALGQAIQAVCEQQRIAFTHHTLELEPTYEPPPEIEALLDKASAALLATKRSYTHSDMVRQARSQGLRVATSPGTSEAQLAAGLATDYRMIARAANDLAKKLDGASQVRVESLSGTNLTFSTKEQRGFAETGLYTEPGSVGNLPAGEASCGIDDRSGEGVLVVNGSYPGLGRPSEPLELHIAGGAIAGVSGKAAEAFSERVPKGKERQLAELGIGLNPAFTVMGNTLLDEKVAGTLHIGFGNDVSFGGSNNVPYHADAVITDATLYLDDVALSL